MSNRNKTGGGRGTNQHKIKGISSAASQAKSPLPGSSAGYDLVDVIADIENNAYDSKTPNISIKPSAIEQAISAIARTPALKTEERQELQQRMKLVKRKGLDPQVNSRLIDKLRVFRKKDQVPTLDMEPINIPKGDDVFNATWETLLELDNLKLPWMLVGGQMTTLLCIENKWKRNRSTDDGDIVVDVFTDKNSFKEITSALARMGFAEDANAGTLSSGEKGGAFRYFKGKVQIDIILPEDVYEPRIKFQPKSIKNRTGISLPGANRALRRAQRVPVTLSNGKSGFIRRPDIVGAIVMKATAAKTDTKSDKDRHDDDLYDLLQIASSDILSVYDELEPKDQERIRKWLNEPNKPIPHNARMVAEALVEQS